MLIILYVPFENNSERSNSGGGKGVPVDDQHVMTHPPVEGNLSDDIHSSIAKLQRYHCYVRLTPLNETAKTTAPLHFSLSFLGSKFSVL